MSEVTVGRRKTVTAAQLEQRLLAGRLRELKRNTTEATQRFLAKHGRPSGDSFARGYMEAGLDRLIAELENQ